MLGNPKDEKFNLYNQDGVDVYVENSVKAKDDILKIRISKILFKEILVVENLDI